MKIEENLKNKYDTLVKGEDGEYLHIVPGELCHIDLTEDSYAHLFGSFAVVAISTNAEYIRIYCQQELPDEDDAIIREITLTASEKTTVKGFDELVDDVLIRDFDGIIELFKEFPETE
jgi:hypothetical protein